MTQDLGSWSKDEHAKGVGYGPIATKLSAEDMLEPIPMHAMEGAPKCARARAGEILDALASELHVGLFLFTHSENNADPIHEIIGVSMSARERLYERIREVVGEEFPD